MTLTELTSAQIQDFLPLLKEKEQLVDKIARINEQLCRLESGGIRVASTAVIKSKGRRKVRKERLKVAILSELKSAGKAGLSVDELSKALKRKKTSIGVWFYTAGKTVKEIRKIGRGRFAIIP